MKHDWQFIGWAGAKNESSTVWICKHCGSQAGFARNSTEDDRDRELVIFGIDLCENVIVSKVMDS